MESLDNLKSFRNKKGATALDLILTLGPPLVLYEIIYHNIFSNLSRIILPPLLSLYYYFFYYQSSMRRLTKRVSSISFQYYTIFIITTFNLKFILTYTNYFYITKLCSQWGLFCFYDCSGRFFILKYVRSIMQYLGPKYVHLTSSFVSGGERKMLIYKSQPLPCCAAWPGGWVAVMCVKLIF